MYDTILKDDISLDERRPGHVKKKFQCPSCGHKKKYVRYFNFTLGDYLPEEFGRCDREHNCGYFEKPSEEYFKSLTEGSLYAPVWKKKNTSCVKSKSDTATQKEKPFSTIEKEILLKSLSGYEGNIFCQFLIDHFGESTGHSLLSKYLIGTSKKYKGANVFWQVDIKGRIRSGKIMLYNKDGHRRKDIYPTWVHTELKREGYQLDQCFFGEHLLKDSKPETTIAIVESEKTAIVASYFFPKNVWLATGGETLLNVEKCKILEGRKVVLFPDLADSARERWEIISQDINQRFGIRSMVSDYLSEVNDGSDIADFLLTLPVEREEEKPKPKAAIKGCVNKVATKATKDTAATVKLKTTSTDKESSLPINYHEPVDLLSRYISLIRPARIVNAIECPF
ncbi:DUF6371 domain-containing protein [Catalinimonas sp. 4WD22]|uniref:DUF6371 domain-containing protein n=1 Tax=Catalinimonas locisalis TaxID=3133978 RepID=UPI0031014355